MRKATRGFTAALCLSCICSARVAAQSEKPVPKDDFLARYRAAVPKLERSLFRNKTIEGVLTTYNPDAGTKEESKWVRNMSYRSNSDRFLLSVRIPRPDKTMVYLFRPGQYYSLARLGEGPFALESNRPFTPDASEAVVSSPFSANDDIGVTNGLGHGLLISDVDWYTVFTDGTLPIVGVSETTHEGRKCYKVVGGQNRGGETQYQYSLL